VLVPPPVLVTLVLVDVPPVPEVPPLVDVPVLPPADVFEKVAFVPPEPPLPTDVLELPPLEVSTEPEEPP
jgi:hypothetical protein